MDFTCNGEAQVLDGMHTVFWVIGSQGGGCTMLGGGTNWAGAGATFNFMRARSGHSDANFRASDPILANNWTVPGSIQSADWRMDGTNITATSTGLSGAWDLISMTIPDAKHAANADGLAIVGRNSGWEKSRGGQRLAEVLIYDRALDAAERESVENYLRTKWGVYGYQASPTNAASVALAADTVLDLGGNAQYVAGISGAGIVSNGTLAVGTLVADMTDALRPEFDESAALAIEPGQRVVVSNVASAGSSTPITVMEGTVVGLENLSSAVVEVAGDAALGSLAPRLKYRNGVLFVKLMPTGMAISFR